MSSSMNLQNALHMWEEHYMTPAALGPHLSDEELNLSLQEDEEQRERIVDHLSRCRYCAERYRGQCNNIKPMVSANSWDIAVLKAAAGEKTIFPIICHSEKNYYRIEVMRNSSGEEDGLAVLTILDPDMAIRHEGVKLWICDAQGRHLLRGQVVMGEVWQKIARLDDYDYSELFVYVADDEDPTLLTN